MKNLFTLSAVLALFFVAPAASAGGDSIGSLSAAFSADNEAIGTLPSTAGKGNTGGHVAANGEVKPVEPPPPYEKVQDGECHTNGDDVKVCNTGDQGDDFRVDPKSGSGSSATTVDMDNNAQGTIDGLDSNDTVNVANGANVAVSGTGGTVNVPSGSSATGSVTNTNPAGGGGGNVTLVAGGVPVNIPPGGSVTFGG